MVFINTTDGKYIDVNPAGARMLGYADKQELMQIRSVDTYLNADERKRFSMKLQKKGLLKILRSN